MLFVTVIVLFAWRVSANGEAKTSLTPGGQLASRIILSAVLFFGVSYFFLIVRSLRRYGEHMDVRWTETIKKKVEEANTTGIDSPTGPAEGLNSPPSIPGPTPFFTSPPPSQMPPFSTSLATRPPHSMPSMLSMPFSSSQTSLISETTRHQEKEIFQDALEVIRFDESQRPLPKAYPPQLLARGITETMWFGLSQVNGFVLYTHGQPVIISYLNSGYLRCLE